MTLPPPPCGEQTAVEPAPKDWVYLSDLRWRSAAAGWTPNGDGLPRLDKSVDDQPMRIANRKHPKGLGTHAPSQIVYALDGGYTRFQAVANPPERGGTVTFRVWGDDKLLCDTGLVRARDARTIDVPLAGVRTLKLEVTDGGDGYQHDCANWASARVQKPAH